MKKKTLRLIFDILCVCECVSVCLLIFSKCEREQMRVAIDM